MYFLNTLRNLITTWLNMISKDRLEASKNIAKKIEMILDNDFKQINYFRYYIRDSFTFAHFKQDKKKEMELTILDFTVSFLNKYEKILDLYDYKEFMMLMIFKKTLEDGIVCY